MHTLLWLIPALPLLGFCINGAMALSSAQSPVGPSRGFTGFLAVLMPAISFILTIVLSISLYNGLGEPALLWNWFTVGSLSVDFALGFDHLTSLMLLFITGIGTLIHVYSIGYMATDRGFTRFMSYLNLFMFSMIMLVMGENLLVTFLGWEGVGLCSYLLIGFWHKDHANNDAAKKAFIMNRVGDLGLLIGMFILVVLGIEATGSASLSYDWLADNVALMLDTEQGVFFLTLATLFIFLGCTGKSAQIPLMTWLPDAMAGPTPVSALIHAATMVTSGVYLCARLSPLFQEAQLTMDVILIIGSATAVYAAVAALVQWDIKKVLAYSTVSQLGFMFMAVGVGAYDVAIYHVLTHAFFKATLFLGSGSVIHALHHEQDMRRMGGLSKKMPLTYSSFVFGWWAIIGMPLGSGFFSKDLILERLHHSTSGLAHIAFWVALAAAVLTALYMTRMMIYTFWSKSRVSEKITVREVPIVMSLPVLILGFGSLLVGCVWAEPVSVLFSWFGAESGTDEIVMINSLQTYLSNAVDVTVFEIVSPTAIMFGAATGTLMAVIGCGFAFVFFRKGPAHNELTPLKGFAAQWTAALDTIYTWTIIRPVMVLAYILDVWVDRGICAGAVRFIGHGTHMVGDVYRLAQRSRAQVSLIMSLCGMLLFIIIALMDVLFSGGQP